MDDEFRRKYPHLANEWGGPSTIRIRAVRSSTEEAEKATHYLPGYQPTAIDFIRRCETDDQALEVINFLERRGETEPSYAKQLRVQLTEHGLRSFGSRRKPGCYERGKTG